MSRFSRWWKRRRRKRRRIFLFGRWFGGGDEPEEFVDPVVPPDPLNGELGISADTYGVIDSEQLYVDVFVERTNGFDGTVSVQYSLVAGTATPGVDYTDVSGTLTWTNLDQSPKSFRIPVLARAVSGDFDLTAVISDPTGGATIVTGLDSADVTISRRGNGEANFAGTPYYRQNPHPTPSVNLTLQVQRNIAFKDTVTVNWHTVDGTALAGVDYTAGSGTLTWVNGDGNPKSIIIPILGRAGGPFGDRNFTVVLDTPTGGIVIGSINPATVTLTDGVPPANPVVSASIANQIVDPFYTVTDEILAGDEFAVANHNILSYAYVGNDVNGNINSIIDSSLADLLGVHVAFGTNVGVACGTNGIIIRTTDNGVLWSRPYSGVSVTLRAAIMFSSTVGWVVGDNGTILKTTDGGATWVQQTSGTTENLYAVMMNSATVAFACGANGTILKTTDGGANWVAKTSGTTETLRGMITIGANGWIVGHNGTVLVTTNTADTWASQTSGTTENLHAVWMRDASNAWACGANGTIIRTSNGGANWGAQTSGTTNDLNGINMFSLTVGWIVGEAGTILKTTNGTAWNAQTSNTSKNLNAVSYTEAGANVVLAVGDDMTVDRTANGGTNWGTVPTPAIVIGAPSAGQGGGIDVTSYDDSFAPTSRFALSGLSF